VPAVRPVKVGGANGSNWVVLGGLQPGEQVIVDGFQKMRPGAPVSPVPWAPGGKPAGGPGAAGAAASGPAAAGSAVPNVAAGSTSGAATSGAAAASR
jgi:membrane fusion protein (multidrug efflux system)